MAGFPSTKSTTSYWQTQPSPLAHHGADTALPQFAEYVIIGSGITGTTIASKLLKRNHGANIVMLEARAAASGASSRNGGHCRPVGYHTFPRDLAALGRDEAMRIQKFEEDNGAELVAFIRQNDIECDLRAVDTVDIFIDPARGKKDEAALKAFEESIDLDGEPRPAWFPKLKLVHGAQAVEASGMLDAGSVISFSAFKVQPYKLVTGMLDRCLKAGLALYTHTMVRSISRYTRENDKDTARWTVVTDRGELRTANVILATNGYTPALHAPLEGKIIPTRGQVAALRPGSLIAGAPALQRTAGIYNKVSIDYCQTRSEDTDGAGDIIIGGGRMHAPGGEQPLTDDSDIHPMVSKYLCNVLPDLFGDEKWGEHGEVLMEWTGIMGYTEDSRPYIGQIPGEDGKWVCAGFNGHGMALTYRAAEALVQLLEGGDDTAWIPHSFRIERIAGANGSSR